MGGSPWALAIDFGTSRCAGAMAADGAVTALEVEGNRWMPSLVLADPDGGVLVGTAADNQAGVYPDRVERTPKRHLGTGAPLVLGDATVAVPDAVAALLRVFVAEGRLRRSGAEPGAVVLTHPVRWADERKADLLVAAGRAGLHDCVLIEEPVAAAVHYAADQVAPGQYVGVYDLGGGTFDTAVLRRTEGGFEVVGEPGGDEFIGGEDFDHRLYRYFGECLGADDAELWELICTSDERRYRRAALDLLVQARRAKEALSTWTSTQVFVPIADRDLVVNRSQFEAMVIDDIERTVALMADTVASAGIGPGDLAALYLVGGSSRLPLVVQLLSEQFGPRVTTRDEPKGVVALGAAMVAGGVLAARAEAARAGSPAGPVVPAEAPAGQVAPVPPAGSVPTPPAPRPGAALPPPAAPLPPPRPTPGGPGGAGLGALAPGLQRWGEKVAERTRAMFHAMAATARATTAGPAVADLVVTGGDGRPPDVRWRLQLRRPAGQLAAAGDTVFFGTDDGDLHALGALDGAVRWRRALESAVTHPPVAHGDGVVVGGHDGVVSRLGGSDGSWSWRVGLGAALAAPVMACEAGLVAATSAGTVFGLDPATGAARWRVELGAAVRHVMAVTASTGVLETSDGRLTHFAATNGAVVWRADLPSSDGALPVASGRLVLVPDRSTVSAVDVTTGALAWRCELGTAVTGALGADGSLAYAATADGGTYAVDLATGALRWRHPSAGPYSSGPVVSSGCLHIDDGNGTVRVVDLGAGAVRWSLPTGPYNRARPARCGAMVVVATPHAQVYGVVA